MKRAFLTLSTLSVLAFVSPTNAGAADSGVVIDQQQPSDVSAEQSETQQYEDMGLVIGVAPVVQLTPLANPADHRSQIGSAPVVQPTALENPADCRTQSGSNDTCCGDSSCGDGVCDACCGAGCGSGCCDPYAAEYINGVGYGLGLGSDAVNVFAVGQGFYYDPATRWVVDEMLLGDSPLLIGGWTSMGYHNQNTRQSLEPNDLGAYNDQPDRLNLHQTWLFLAKEADGSGGLDWGFRTDVVYGTDAQKLQATGNERADEPGFGSWDASLDHGSYGWAIPQAYGELALGDWSIIGGYFLTPIGYESSLAPENFFYSHSLTMYNSEPFTHTGALACYNGLDNAILFGGWTMGWDTAFDDFLGGNSAIGGFATDLGDNVSFSYFSTVGDFGFRGEDGYAHSTVMQVALAPGFKYVAQSDYVSHDDSFGEAGFEVEEYGLNQYLLYRLTDSIGLGTRMEWWKSNSVVPGYQSFYETTAGINVIPASNVVIRPEIRYDWTPGNVNFENETGVDYDQWVFGVDCVVTY